MTEKERLEEIKVKVNNTIDTMLYVPYGDIKFLIEQAERVHGKNNLIGLAGMYEDCNRMVANLTSQNKRYREAIKKGINATRYTNPEVAYILAEALEGEE